MVSIKELDGSREITVEAHGGSVFVEGHGFAYEFDEGIFVHGIRKAVMFRYHPLAAIQYPPKRVSELWTPAESPDLLAGAMLN